MKKLESSLLNMTLVLTGVAVVMGGILAFVNHLTEGPIQQQKEKALTDGIKTVMVCNDLVVANTDEVTQTIDGKEVAYTIYEIKNQQGKELGAAVESTTMGFGGNLKVLVSRPSWDRIPAMGLFPPAGVPEIRYRSEKGGNSNPSVETPNCRFKSRGSMLKSRTAKMGFRWAFRRANSARCTLAMGR